MRTRTTFAMLAAVLFTILFVASTGCSFRKLGVNVDDGHLGRDPAVSTTIWSGVTNPPSAPLLPGYPLVPASQETEPSDS